MKRLKELLKAYFAPYEQSGAVAGNPACTTDEIAEAMVAAVAETFQPITVAGIEAPAAKPKKAAAVAKPPVVATNA